MAALRISSLKQLDAATRRKIRGLLTTDQREVSNREGIRIDDEQSESKWHNIRTELDGITFQSAHEAHRYAELKIELLAGEIKELELQKRFSLDVNGFHICNYFADFVYKRDGVQIVEDAKGKPTDLYKIKRALMLAIFGIKIVEV